MTFFSWNVNGIRAVIKKGFSAFLRKEKPDVLCLQEIKISDAKRAETEFDFHGYKEFWNSAERPGYSGTAILVKDFSLGIIKQTDGFGIPAFDKEGRVQTLEFDKFYLLNIYFPNANHELSRLGFKIKFNEAFLKYAKSLEKKKPVIATGDFNVAHEEMDLARPKDNVGNPGFTGEERADMTMFLKNGFIDTFRFLHPKKVQYSWWSYRSAARIKNIGWRIDYFLVSAKLVNRVKRAFIMDDIYGSDHCPVGIEIS